MAPVSIIAPPVRAGPLGERAPSGGCLAVSPVVADAGMATGQGARGDGATGLHRRGPVLTHGARARHGGDSGRSPVLTHGAMTPVAGHESLQLSLKPLPPVMGLLRRDVRDDALLETLAHGECLARLPGEQSEPWERLVDPAAGVRFARVRQTPDGCSGCQRDVDVDVISSAADA